ncbi:MAG: 23S rRNA (adenine(2503)-C(2))-methyltransferase RlmN [Acidobacteriota bacterium]|nr:23S rRNA (adenine(2503)-C(2))-methyltransferase RlmN [Acidobacteriota bacterium]
MATPKKNLYGLSLEELQEVLIAEGEKPFRAKQIYAWLYAHKVTEIQAMTNLSKDLRARLEAGYVIEPPRVAARHVSSDGSVKYVFDAGEGRQVEAVYMPMEKGITLCLSSQVGCAQDCSFCMTAQMGFIRNLSPGEIVGQAAVITQEKAVDGPFNLVMMGMGEPLLNLQNLIKALDIFTHKLGFDLSPKRITVSTSGHVRNLEKLGEYPKLPRIAVSLNATTDEVRNEIMPVNLKWNIRELIDACKRLPISQRDRITFEYVLLEGVNDTPADARRLVRLVSNIRCKVNIIPFNEMEGLDYKQPDLETIERFRQALNKSGILNTVRWSKGRDVGAACGQLATPVAKRGAHLREKLHV